MPRPFRFLVLLAIPIVLPHTTLAQPGAAADSLYRAADYAAAAELYREAAAQHPDSGRFWYRLGASLYQVGSYDPAIEVTPNPDGTVRHHSERSEDEGATWTTYFDVRYLRVEAEGAR